MKTLLLAIVLGLVPPLQEKAKGPSYSATVKIDDV